MIRFTEKDGHITFEIIARPRASQSTVVGEVDGALKITIAAPPVEGQANAECERFLARWLGVRRTDIEIVAGATNRRKLVRVRGLSRAALIEKLHVIR